MRGFLILWLPGNPYGKLAAVDYVCALLNTAEV